MDADEREICLYMRGWIGQFVSAVEIARRAAGKKRYRDDPNWAVPVLSRLVEKGILESDSTGHFRLKPRSKKEDAKRRWVAPHIRRILEKSGRQFEDVHELRDDDDPQAFLDSLENNGQA
jgi:hypothetical protein